VSLNHVTAEFCDLRMQWLMKGLFAVEQRRAVENFCWGNGDSDTGDMKKSSYAVGGLLMSLY
jgi:hypothetical protein